MTLDSFDRPLDVSRDECNRWPSDFQRSIGETPEERADRLNLFPGQRALVLVEVEILTRSPSSRGPVFGVAFPRPLLVDDFASEESLGKVAGAAAVQRRVGASSLRTGDVSPYRQA